MFLITLFLIYRKENYCCLNFFFETLSDRKISKQFARGEKVVPITFRLYYLIADYNLDGCNHLIRAKINNPRIHNLTRILKKKTCRVEPTTVPHTLTHEQRDTDTCTQTPKATFPIHSFNFHFSPRIFTDAGWPVAGDDLGDPKIFEHQIFLIYGQRSVLVSAVRHTNLDGLRRRS